MADFDRASRTGETRPATEVLAPAYELGKRAVLDSQSVACPVNGMYIGKLGIALLCSDLLCPEGSTMPLFEGEGWPVPRRDRVSAR